MSQGHHSQHDDLSDDESFYNEGNPQSPQQKSEKDKVQNIPSKSDIFKKKKIKKIRGHSFKKPKTSKQEQRERKNQQDAQEQAEKIIEEMDKRYEEDKHLYKNKKPASRKLSYLGTLSQKLKKLYVWDKFLELGGLERFQLWFARLPEGIEPSLTLRKGLLQILDSLKIKSEYISKVSEIQSIVKKHKKSQTKEIRQLSESILMKWSKTIHEDQE